MPREASNDGPVSHGQLPRTSKSAHVPMFHKAQTDRSNRQRSNKFKELESDASFNRSDMTILHTLLNGRHGRGMSYEEVLNSLDGVRHYGSHC